MTYYLKEINRIKRECYSNQWQLETVIAIRKFIDNHFDTDLNLETLSHIHFTSKFHLLRLYKRYYGQTPKQYLTEIRIQRAKEFLASGKSVTETCFLIGFNSLGSFSYLFTSKVGIPPSQFRKEQLSRNFC